MSFCSNCPTLNTCSDCIASFVVVNNSVCSCPTGTTFSIDYCYTCTIANCVTCNQTNYCSVCEGSQNYVASQGVCICQNGYT